MSITTKENSIKSNIMLHLFDIIIVSEYILNKLRKRINTQQTLIILMDMSLFNIIYLLLNKINRDSFVLTATGLKLMIIINIITIIDHLINRKFNLKNYKYESEFLISMIKSTVFVLFITNMIIVFFNIIDFSRFQFFGSFIGWLFIESILTLIIVRHPKQIKLLVYQAKPKTQHVSWILMAYDYILLIVSILISLIINYKRIHLNIYGFESIIVLSCLWYINSCYTGKFNKGKRKNIAYAFSPYLFTYFITISEIAILVYAFRKFGASKELLYLPNTILLAFELPLSNLYFLKKSFTMNEPDIESLEQARSFIDISLANEGADVKPVRNPSRESLNARFRKDNAALFEFIDRNITLNEIDESQTTILKNHNEYNLNMLNDHSVIRFINLQRINDIRRINKY
jgi:hypothetical protein